jgi:hypothetical protein
MGRVGLRPVASTPGVVALRCQVRGVVGPGVVVATVTSWSERRLSPTKPIRPSRPARPPRAWAVAVVCVGGQCRCPRRWHRSGRRNGVGDKGTENSSAGEVSKTPNVLCIMVAPQLDRPMATGKGLRTS